MRNFTISVRTVDFPLWRMCNAVLIGETDKTYIFETVLYTIEVEKDKLRKADYRIDERSCISFKRK